MWLYGNSTDPWMESLPYIILSLFFFYSIGVPKFIWCCSLVKKRKCNKNLSPCCHVFQVFQGNFDNDTHRKNVIDPPIYARFVRILPWSWYGRITLRVEILGCTEQEWCLCHLHRSVNYPPLLWKLKYIMQFFRNKLFNL